MKLERICVREMAEQAQGYARGICVECPHRDNAGRLLTMKHVLSYGPAFIVSWTEDSK